MSIVFGGTITPSATVEDMIFNPANNQLMIIDSANNLRFYNTATQTLLTTYGTQTNPQGLTIINNASAICGSSSLTTINFIELSSGFTSTVSGGLVTNFTQKIQQMAADPNSGVAFQTSSTVNTLVRISTSFAVTQIKIGEDFSNGNWSSVIFKSPGRFLIGSTQGTILEIDLAGNVQDSFRLSFQSPMSTSSGIYNQQTPGDPPTANYLSYDNNLLQVITNQALFTIDWTTKTIIKTVPVNTSTSTSGLPDLICQGSSGETLFSRNYTSSNRVVQEIDYTVSPTNTHGELYTNNTGVISLLTMSQTTGQAVAYQPAIPAIYCFTVTPRATTTRTVTVNPGGINQKARLILIDDTGGVGNSFVFLDTNMQSPATYRVPTGKTIKEIVKVGSGTGATWDMSSYST
jgi:hypothetical protein